jgi:hypothetical protein
MGPTICDHCVVPVSETDRTHINRTLLTLPRVETVCQNTTRSTSILQGECSTETVSKDLPIDSLVSS